MRIQLVDCERTILDEIAQPEATKIGIARTYWLCMRSDESSTLSWTKVNAAITARWGVRGLNYIKRMSNSGSCWKDQKR